MGTESEYHDSFEHLCQDGGARGVLLVRITGADGDNRYTARPVEFDETGNTQPVGDDELTVTNLAEAASDGGSLPADTEALAVDVEGRWVIHVRQRTAAFPARVIAPGASDGRYNVLEQVVSSSGEFSDKPDAVAVSAVNLAELSLGDGAAVDDDSIVLVTAIPDISEPPTLRYVFDHATYA
ncbi:MAG: hypothetical protein R6V58_12775, partial [Planctomycetota bacterium]